MMIIEKQRECMKIKVTADSTCDLSPELAAKYDITLFPLYVIRDGKMFRDGVDIDSKAIFTATAQTGRLCGTAAVNTEDYRVRFAEFSERYDAVIHICLSSELSSCYQNASIAASQFSNVHVIDSRSLSTGSGLMVLAAADLAREGLGEIEIVSRLREMPGKVEASFVMDRLDYMQKGGRCS